MEKVGSFFGNRNGSFMKIYYPLLRWRRGTRPAVDITSITHITNSIFDVERITTAIASIYFYSKQTCITPIKRSAWIRSIHVFLPFFLSLSPLHLPFCPLLFSFNGSIREDAVHPSPSGCHRQIGDPAKAYKKKNKLGKQRKREIKYERFHFGRLVLAGPTLKRIT